ncbi:MAG: site-2 protease family protein [Candidatus Micrarchaeaceae archaeon]
MPQGTLRIGKIAGIDIELHWLFILLILVFIYISPLLGFIWILLFICVLIHELSHSITAIRNGITVTKIVLLPIGGASIINDIAIDPSIEFNIAIAGPIMSFFLGALFGILVIFTPPGVITYLVQYLFAINILLGAFNILPAFPMDGGRVLRSFLQRRKSFYDATMTTAKVSKYCMALIILGTLVFIAIPSGYSFFSKEIILVWDFIIVFFLYEGMKAEQNSVIIKQETRGMSINDAMNTNFSTIGWNSKPRALYILVKKKKEHLIFTKSPSGNYALVNVFDKQEISKASSISDLAIQVPNVQHNASISDVMSSIDGTAFRVAAVLKGKKLVGIATGQHIAAFLTLHTVDKNNRKGLK